MISERTQLLLFIHSNLCGVMGPKLGESRSWKRKCRPEQFRPTISREKTDWKCHARPGGKVFLIRRSKHTFGGMIFRNLVPDSPLGSCSWCGSIALWCALLQPRENLPRKSEIIHWQRERHHDSSSLLMVFFDEQLEAKKIESNDEKNKRAWNGPSLIFIFWKNLKPWTEKGKFRDQRSGQPEINLATVPESDGIIRGGTIYEFENRVCADRAGHTIHMERIHGTRHSFFQGADSAAES